MDIYRASIKLTSKDLHILHMKILFNFSEIVNVDQINSKENQLNFNENPKNSSNKKSKTEEEKIHKILVDIVIDLSTFFNSTPSYKFIYEEFKQIKYVEIELQLLITKIVANISIYSAVLTDLIDNCLFAVDFVEYLIKVSKSGKTDKKTFLMNLSNNQIVINSNIDNLLTDVLTIVENLAFILLKVYKASVDVIVSFEKKVV